MLRDAIKLSILMFLIGFIEFIALGFILGFSINLLIYFLIFLLIVHVCIAMSYLFMKFMEWLDELF
jgi:hypothetical protein